MVGLILNSTQFKYNGNGFHYQNISKWLQNGLNNFKITRVQQ